MRSRTAAAGIVALGALLTAAYFPMLFSGTATYDDEGFFLAILRQFLRHGSLYHQTRTAYGPFYFSLMGALYRITGQSPTLFNGRVISLALIALSAGVFAATVWRVTRSLAFTLFGEVVTYIVLIRVAGFEQLHPGLLIVLLLSMMVYGLASYALEQRTVFLVLVGATVGAILMTKINVGLFAAVSVVIAFVIGNRRYPKALRTIVATGGAVLPFVLMFQRLYLVEIALFALLVSLALFLSYAPMHVEEISLPRRALVVVAAAAVVAMIVSVVWPFATGTGPSSLVNGVLIRPLGQADRLAVAPTVDLEWLAVIVTICVIWALLARPAGEGPKVFTPVWLPYAALGVAALWVLGIGTLGGSFVGWLPAIVLVPALAWISRAPPETRLVLRFLVPVAILQILHAYPLAGAQQAWGLVVMCVPCIIAIAVAEKRLPLWQHSGRAWRPIAVGSLAALLALGGAASPISAWYDYTKLTPLNLRGARLVRVPQYHALELQKLTVVVRKRCDTFYSAPGLDSLYIYTDLPAPTGMLSNWPGVLSSVEQRVLVSQLRKAAASGKRVCIVRDLTRQKLWLKGYGRGPLGKALARFRLRIALVGRYSVSIRG